MPTAPNHDRRYLIEPAKIERELGWRPSVDFTAGLAKTVDWYVENEDWWQDILRRKGEQAIRDALEDTRVVLVNGAPEWEEHAAAPGRP